MDTSATYTLTDKEKEASGDVDNIISVRDKYNVLYLEDVEIASKLGKEMFDLYQETGEIFYAEMAAKYGYSNSVDKEGDRKSVV